MITLKNIATELNLIPINKPIIVVGGTNGKGSCVAFLSAILQAAGYHVGTFTSPHLYHYNERIQCNGIPVTDAEITEAFNYLEKFELNYFEQATLAALYIFQKKPLDVLVLEVGLGGRLDPVNIVDADLAIISTVSLDHVNELGDTREKIGWEKAHIFRANKPAVCGDFKTPESVKKYAKEIGANLFCYGDDYDFVNDVESWSWSNNLQRADHLPLPLLPLQNAATVLQALTQFILPISIEAIFHGLKNASLPGRFQIIKEPVLQVLDVAHNPESAMLLAKNLQQQNISGKTFAVVGMLADKDIAATLAPLLPLVDHWYVATLDHPRGASSEELLRHLKANSKGFKNIVDAHHEAMQDAKPNDRIVIFGSFHTVSLVGKTWIKNS